MPMRRREGEAWECRRPLFDRELIELNNILSLINRSTFSHDESDL